MKFLKDTEVAGTRPCCTSLPCWKALKFLKDTEVAGTLKGKLIMAKKANTLKFLKDTEVAGTYVVLGCCTRETNVEIPERY